MEDPPLVRSEPSSSAIPLGVKLVAWWQFIKAAGLVAIFCGVGHSPVFTFLSGHAGQAAGGTEVALIFMGIVVLYPVVLGFGVWNLQRWARWLILPAFALVAPVWAIGSLPKNFGLEFLRELLPPSIVPVVATLDVLAILALLLPDSRRAFGDSEQDVEDGNSLLG